MQLALLLLPERTYPKKAISLLSETGFHARVENTALLARFREAGRRSRFVTWFVNSGQTALGTVWSASASSHYSAPCKGSCSLFEFFEFFKIKAHHHSKENWKAPINPEIAVFRLHNTNNNP